MDLVLYPSQKADTFAAVFQHIRLFCDHVNLVFEPSRLYMQCMDNAHVAILELDLPADWFDRYELTSGAVTFGIHAGFLYRILAAREKDQQLHIVYSEADNDVLRLHFTSGESAAKNASFDKHFEIPLLSLDSETMEIPGIEYAAEISISSSHFAGIINQLKMFGDTMEIQCSEDKIMLASNSQDQGKMFVEIRIDDVSAFAIDEGSELNLSFSLTYLHHICMYNKLAKEVELKFSESYPMQIVYILASSNTKPESSSESKDARLLFYLAPKIAD
jgi:proliferating cell nuclear antigen PCNA